MSMIRVTILVWMLPVLVNAGILIEPYAGYNVGLDLKTKLSRPSTTQSFIVSTNTKSGQTFGGRLGYSFLNVFAAVDYSKTSFDIDEKTDRYISGSFDTKFIPKITEVDETALGIAVGVDIFILRAWGKYLFDVKWESNPDYIVGVSYPHTVELKGTGYAVGLGIKPLPFISLFAEYQMVTVDEWGIFTRNTDGLDRKGEFKLERERKSLLIGISVPIDI